MGRPANTDSRQTRAAVLAAALDLFAQKGYFGTSLRDIANVVGVRESALYNYFASKEQLFEALIAASAEQRVERVTELSEAPVDDVRALLEALVRQTLQAYCHPRQEQLFRILMADGLRLARNGRINLMERLSAGQGAMRGLMLRLMREGWLETADPDVVMMAFGGPLLLWRHLNAIGAAHPALSNRAAFARTHVEQFLRGAGAPRAFAVRQVQRARGAAAERRRPSGARKRNVAI